MGLKDMDAEFDGSAKAERKDFTPVPDGHYQVRVATCGVGKTKRPPARDMLSLELEIIAGPHKGRKLFKNIMLEKHATEGFKYLKADLEVLGWKHKLSDLEDMNLRFELLDRTLNVNKKTKGTDEQGRPKEQVFLNSALGTPPPASKPSPAQASRASTIANDDEPPF